MFHTQRESLDLVALSQTRFSFLKRNTFSGSCLLALSIAVLLSTSVVWAQSSSEEELSDEAMMMPMMEISPELDLDDPALAKDLNTPANTAQKPLRAKAVLVDVNSNVLNYDKDRDVYIATGDVHVVISEQNSELFADKVTYDQNQDLLIAEGHVIILKNGEETKGSFAKIDLTRESALINDIATQVSNVRIRAKQSLLDNDFHLFEDGVLTIDPTTLGQALSGRKVTKKKNSNPKAKIVRTEVEDEFSLSRLAFQNQLNSGDVDDESAITLQEAIEQKDHTFHIHSKEIDIHRWEDGYTKVDMKWPSLYWGKHRIATLGSTQFSNDAVTGETEYLGPDIGFDGDYGGLYAGPGWDFRTGKHSSLRFSPLVSAFGGGRRSRSGRGRFNSDKGLGIGGIAHYRGKDTLVDAAYNSSVGQPVLYAERKIFDGKTLLRTAINEDYNGGFLGFERPGYAALVSDTRNVAKFGAFEVDSYASAGYYKDDFFPNNQTNELVDTDEFDDDPASAGRVQLQARLRNVKPLVKVNDHVSFGFQSLLAGAAYSTGDFVGMWQSGPSMRMRFGNRFSSFVLYNYAVSVGETPFLFDTYYRGRQNVRLNNSFRVNNFITVGNRVTVSPLRDNSANNLLTDNAFYILAGPKNVKFNLAYDFIRQRSFFGIKFFPGTGGQPVHYDKLRIYEPEDFTGHNHRELSDLPADD